MKTDRRHELKQNELADVLARWIAVVSPYSRLIVGVLIAACVVGGVTIWYEYQSRSSAAKAWTDYFNEGIKIDGRTGQPDVDFEVLGQLASDEADQPVGQWALVSSADHRLTRGVRMLLKLGSWDKGQEELDTAVQEYTNVLKAVDTANNPQRDNLLRQRAVFGLARAHESRGELDRAKEQYQKLVDETEQGPYARIAEKQLKAIDTPAVRRFYAELKSTISSQANPFGTRGDATFFDKLKEKIDILNPPEQLGDEDSGSVFGKELFPPTDPAPEKKPSTDKPAPSLPPQKSEPKAEPKPIPKAPLDESKPDGGAPPPTSKVPPPPAPKPAPK